MNKTIKFGTDGIRGNAQDFPFNTDALIALGLSIAEWSIKKYKKEKPKILIGHDTRISCERIKNDLEIGLLNFDLEILDAKILPTPAICKIINNDKTFDFGIIISASHNKYQDNGIKLVDAKSGKLCLTDEKIIESNFKKNFANLKNIIFEKKGSILLFNNAEKSYIDLILKEFKPFFLVNKKIVLDCANGATYKVAEEIFKQLGSIIEVINNNPNGTNINENCGSLHTEKLSQKVILTNSDCGFAFDGDGDRVIGVDKNGQIIDGDQIIATLIKHPKAKKYKAVVGTSMTNFGLELHLKNNNLELIRTDVGDKFVAKELKSKNLFLGGESSGHIIMTDYLSVGDGIFTALRALETILFNKIDNLKQFEQTPQILININVKEKKDLNSKPLAIIVEKYKNILNEGRILVRYSGTENLLRIMVEGKNQIMVNDLATKLSLELKKELI